MRGVYMKKTFCMNKAHSYKIFLTISSFFILCYSSCGYLTPQRRNLSIILVTHILMHKYKRWILGQYKEEVSASVGCDSIEEIIVSYSKRGCICYT